MNVRQDEKGLTVVLRDDEAKAYLRSMLGEEKPKAKVAKPAPRVVEDDPALVKARTEAYVPKGRLTERPSYRHVSDTRWLFCLHKGSPSYAFVKRLIWARNNGRKKGATTIYLENKFSGKDVLNTVYFLTKKGIIKEAGWKWGGAKGYVLNEDYKPDRITRKRQHKNVPVVEVPKQEEMEDDLRYEREEDRRS